MPAKRRPSIWRRIGRAIGDAAVFIGMARGVSSGGRGGSAPADRYAAVNMTLGEAGRDYDSRTSERGLLDRVPPWLLLAVVIIGFLLGVFVYQWR
jgi:hypothetical protein